MSATLVRTTAGGREQFVELLASEFGRAHIDYVILHGEHSAARDTDVDIAVSRRSLATLDALICSGRFGRLVQRVDYDIPWARCYVVVSDEPDRRYREIDIACDPWGIGPCGPGLPLALRESTVSARGIRVPRSGAQLVYLAAKRAQGGLRHPSDSRELATAFANEPGDGRRLLEEAFGSAGLGLANTLGDGEDPSLELAKLARQLRRRTLRPKFFALKALFGTVRLIRRLMRPTGLTVCLVGPDGVGKSTLAEELLNVTSLGPFRGAKHAGQRGGFLPPPARLVGRPLADARAPHSRQPSGLAGSLGRLAYLWVDTAIGFGPKVFVPRVRNTLVVLERGFGDLAVDRVRYRLSVPLILIRVLERLLPRPDLVLVLDASAPTIHRRKPELVPNEIERQRLAWLRRAAADPKRYAIVPSEGETSKVLSHALEVVEDFLVARLGGSDRAQRTFSALGSFAVGGERHRIVRVAGRPRWILPRGSFGPRTLGLYRPARLGRLARAFGLDLAALTGRLGALVELDPATGLAPVIGEALGCRRIRLAAAITYDARGERALMRVSNGQEVVAWAKVAEDRESLLHEQLVLDALARVPRKVIVAPSVIAVLEWRGLSVLLLAPTTVRGLADRRLARPELDALGELAHLRLELGLPFQIGTGVLVHGDFAPWNSARLPSGRLSLWDWESARVGLPLEDLYHWHFQRLALFGVGSPERVVRDAFEPQAATRRVCVASEWPLERAPESLRAYLEFSLPKASERGHGRAVIVRKRALELLEEVGQ